MMEQRVNWRRLPRLPWSQFNKARSLLKEKMPKKLRKRTRLATKNRTRMVLAKLNSRARTADSRRLLALLLVLIRCK